MGALNLNTQTEKIVCVLLRHVCQNGRVRSIQTLKGRISWVPTLSCWGFYKMSVTLLTNISSTTPLLYSLDRITSLSFTSVHPFGDNEADSFTEGLWGFLWLTFEWCEVLSIATFVKTLRTELLRKQHSQPPWPAFLIRKNRSETENANSAGPRPTPLLTPHHCSKWTLSKTVTDDAGVLQTTNKKDNKELHGKILPWKKTERSITTIIKDSSPAWWGAPSPWL